MVYILLWISSTWYRQISLYQFFPDFQCEWEPCNVHISPHLQTPINSEVFQVVGQRYWVLYKVLFTALTFVYMAIYDLEIKLA